MPDDYANESSWIVESNLLIASMTISRTGLYALEESIFYVILPSGFPLEDLCRSIAIYGWVENVRLLLY